MPSSFRSASRSSPGTPTIVQYVCRASRYFGYVPRGASRAMAAKKSFGDAENATGFTASSAIP
jgi:hypothetical protein